jgi:signal peptidase I
MTASAQRAEGASSPLDPVHAVSRFFQEDPTRILTVASHLRAPDRMLESTVLGMSMGATIPAGSRVRIELGEQQRYDAGDIVTFVAGHHVVVHRIVRWTGRGSHGCLLTRGDAALVPDRPIAETHILGRVTAVRREEGWTPVGPPPSVAGRARLTRSLVLLAVAGLLQLHPRAAAAFVAALHRVARPFRRSGRTPPPAPFSAV